MAGTKGATRFSLTPHPLKDSETYLSSLPLCCIVFGNAFVLLWVIRRMIRQDAIEHADGFVTDRHEGTLSCPFARGLLLATLVICPEMRVMRDETQGIMLEPMSEVGAAHV